MGTLTTLALTCMIIYWFMTRQDRKERKEQERKEMEENDRIIADERSILEKYNYPDPTVASDEEIEVFLKRVPYIIRRSYVNLSYLVGHKVKNEIKERCNAGSYEYKN